MVKALWDKLGTLYQSKSLVNKLFLRKKLYKLRMKDGDLVTEHLNAFNTVISQLLSADIKILYEDKCISLLCSLPDSWDNLVIAIGSNATALQFDEIVSSLLMEEMRWKNMESQNGDALSIRGWSQKRNKNKSSSGRSKSRGRSKSLGKPVKAVCWKCGKEGNYKRDCKSKAHDKGKGSDDAPSAEAKTTSDEGGDVYLASSSTHVDHEAWLIDLGASFHFTPHIEWFCEYEKYDGGDVFLGDDKKARIIGRGKLKLKLQGGRVRTLPGVLHIPALARNLISVNKLDDAENLVVSGEKTMLWRQRLGHIREKGLRILHGKGMVEGMSNTSLDFDFCENCIWEAESDREEDKGAEDSGGEFCSKEFEEFCKKCGIAQQKTTPYTPEQNEVAERMNKTLMERARSMFSGAELG
eukprot:PITA_30795